MSDPQAVAEASAAAMYAQDRASQALGMQILEIRPGYARLAMSVREDMVNGHKICHGGLIFTLADSAFAFACNTYDLVTVASSGSIEFLLPVRLGDELTAIAEERSRSKRTGVYDVAVRNQRGECVAMFRGRSHEIGGRIGAGS
ncbi:MAG TPA: hydroxyphenylacetyl-CoA thioesterase PaaI [Steroidobacteraceae bacterium]|jgi:phenylacetic acid degradation protein PaaD|nr:hydroxyphenylacetyl-CoA thioesterase PaaI [Steroidobacteraceae bacterium]